MQSKESIIGKALKERLNIQKDSTIVLLNADFAETGVMFNKAMSVKVVSTLNLGVPDIENSTVYIHKKDFQALFGHNNISNIRIFLNDISKQNKVLNLLESELSDNFYVSGFNERHAPRLKNLTDIFSSISIIAYFLIAICLLNMVSSISLIIESKDRDIKILKLTGMSNFYTYLIFLLITFLSTFLSFFSGLILSVILIYIQNNFHIISISPDVYIIPELVGVLDFNFLFNLFLLLTTVSLLLSFYPYLKSLVFKDRRLGNV